MRLLREKAQFVKDFLADVTRMYKASVGKTLQFQDFIRPGISLLKNVFTLKFLRQGVKFLARNYMASWKKSPWLTLGATLITIAATVEVAGRLKILFYSLGDELTYTIVAALGVVPFMDEWAVAHLEEEAIKANTLMKGAKYIYEDANLTELQKVIVTSMALYQKDYLENTAKMKKVRLDQSGRLTEPPSAESGGYGPDHFVRGTDNRMKKDDLGRHIPNKQLKESRLKITLGIIKESKQNNKKLKIILG